MRMKDCACFRRATNGDRFVGSIASGIVVSGSTTTTAAASIPDKLAVAAAKLPRARAATVVQLLTLLMVRERWRGAGRSSTG